MVDRSYTRSGACLFLEIEITKGLDWIVMKCLEGDRTRRYETANGVALDIERHLKQRIGSPSRDSIRRDIHRGQNNGGNHRSIFQ